MHIMRAAERIKELYRTFDTDQKNWDIALDEFKSSLEETDDPIILERCVLADAGWELSVDERIKLLRKAKLLGCDSKIFLLDYYGYMGAHLDPGPEKQEADEKFSALNQE